MVAAASLTPHPPFCLKRRLLHIIGSWTLLGAPAGGIGCMRPQNDLARISYPKLCTLIPSWAEQVQRAC